MDEKYFKEDDAADNLNKSLDIEKDLLINAENLLGAKTTSQKSQKNKPPSINTKGTKAPSDLAKDIRQASETDQANNQNLYTDTIVFLGS